MKEIPLSQNEVAIVDDCDFDYLMQWKWTVKTGNGKLYAYRTNRDRVHGEVSHIRMHRVVLQRMLRSEGRDMPSVEELVTDHINGDGLDNRRRNLRLCNNRENARNRSLTRTNTTSRYKGVVKRGDNWSARIQTGEEYKALGLYSDEVVAAFVYDQAAKKYHGQFAKLNLPDISEHEIRQIEERIDRCRRIARKRGEKTSKYHGVCKQGGKWLARTQHNNKYIFIGSYDSEEQAAREYDKKAIELRGDKAKLNFPLDGVK